MKMPLGLLLALYSAIAFVAGAAPAQDQASRPADKEARRAARVADSPTSAPAERVRRRAARVVDSPTSASAERRPQRKMAWVDPDTSAPPGTRYKTFHSPTINGDVSYLIYLPPDYETSTDKRYPVVYWLHGSGSNQRRGAEMVARLDPAIRGGRAQPMIVVLVNGLAAQTMYCNTPDGKWPLESVIIKDLIPRIDASYRTIAKREARGVEGFSMGGFGAAHLGFKYPDLFGVVSILAPALLGPDLPGNAPRRKWEDLFSTALGGDLAYFQANSPYELAVKNAAKLRGRSIIRIVPHGPAENWLIPRCEKLHALLDENGIRNDLIVCASVQQHNLELVYDTLGDKGIGFFTDAFPKEQN